MQLIKIALLCFSFAGVACDTGTDGGSGETGAFRDDGPGDQTDQTDETYKNVVNLVCNGQVLVDETFTSRADCEAFRAGRSFNCAGIELPFNC